MLLIKCFFYIIINYLCCDEKQSLNPKPKFSEKKVEYVHFICSYYFLKNNNNKYKRQFNQFKPQL